MGKNSIPLLKNFATFAPENWRFVGLYLGIGEEVGLPHKFSWATAQDHWERVNSVILASDFIDNSLPRAKKIARAAVISAQLLMALALKKTCPQCPTETLDASQMLGVLQSESLEEVR